MERVRSGLLPIETEPDGRVDGSGSSPLVGAFSALSEAPALLVVDDEAELLEMFARRLTKAGFDVATASSGEDAIRLVNERLFHVVICDINMPSGVTGFEVLEHVRAREGRKPAFVFVTGHGEGTPELEMALSLGVDGVYSKPISSRALVSHLRKLCGLPPETTPSAAT